MTDQASPFTDEQDKQAPASAGSVQQDPAVENKPAAFQIPDTVADMIGEGKKYSDAVSALNSIKPAQEHISKLEAENAALREKAEEARRVEEVLAEIKAASQQKAPEGTPEPQVSPEDIAALVDQRYQAIELQKQAAANTKAVVEKMTNHFGEASKADEAYRAKASELGLGLDDLNALSAKSPSAVLAMFGLTKSEGSTPAKSSGSVNTEAMRSDPPKQAPKSIMSGATSKDLVNAWRAFAEE